MMKLNKYWFLWISLFSFIIPVTHARVIDATGAEIFIINEADVGETTTLQFGNIANKFLQWDALNLRFNLNDTLRVSGNLEQEGSVITFDADNITGVGNDIDIVAQQGVENPGIIRYDAAANEWQLSNDGGDFAPIAVGSGGGGGLAPYIESITGGKVNPQSSATLTITGQNFDYNTSVTIPAWPGTIDAVRYLSGNQIEVDVTATANEATYSVVLNNGGLDSTNFENDNGVQALIVETSSWYDLRAGGDIFSAGNAAGNDIRHDATMSINRNENGMYFTGENPWGSWVRFESLAFARGAGTTVEWIFQTDGNMMLGIAGDTDENSTSQWRQGAVMAYFTSDTNHWGYYGSSPINGSTWNQTDSASMPSGATLKLKIENDGSAGQNLTLYQLPSADPSDWDDESNVINTTVSNNANTQTNLVPFLIPRDSVNNYFVALKVE